MASLKIKSLSTSTSSRLSFIFVVPTKTHPSYALVSDGKGVEPLGSNSLDQNSGTYNPKSNWKSLFIRPRSDHLLSCYKLVVKKERERIKVVTSRCCHDKRQ